MKRVTGAVALLITLGMPFLLGFANIRLLITPAFLEWEYSRPGFPPDRYGFSRQQRLELAPVAVEFLLSPDRPIEAIRLLREQTLDGVQIYSQEELDHMIDVKRLTDIILRVAWATGVTVIGGTLGLVWRSETRGAAWNGLFNGAVLTAGILAGISAYILVGWRSFFTRFHELLFPPGSWTFAYSQTLIRLFPERLWFDVAVLLGVGTLVEAILIGLVARWLGRRHQGLGEHQKMN